MYYGLKFTKETKAKIMKVFNTFFDLDNDWTVYCDHITIIHSSHKDWYTASKLLYNFGGHKVLFRIVGVGYNDNVMALQVTTMTANETSHITIATRDGHKPVESNEIKNWYGLYCAEEFEGYLELCD